MRIELGDDEQPDIGLIALIDCIFFLLMFFMVATSFKQQDAQKKEKVHPIELPAAQASLEQGAATKDPLVIGIGKDGDLYVAGEPVSLSALRERLRQTASSSPGHPVRIEGDRRTPYQNIVHVLDLCQFERLNNISMRTRN